MAVEPSYPEDAPVGTAKGSEPPPQLESDAKEDETKPDVSNRTRTLVTGAAIGIGSAALVAALLYANRSRKPAAPKSSSGDSDS